MITKRKLNKKLDLLLQRQNIMMDVLAAVELNYSERRKLVKRWNKLWHDIMECRYKIVDDENGDGK